MPRSICVRVTRKCNAHCGFCQAPDTDSGRLSVAELGAISDLLYAAGVRSLKLSGGEPTTRRDLPEVIRRVSLSGLSVTLISNGIHISAATIKALGEVSATVKLSIHYPNELNDTILGRPCFESVVGSVSRLREAGIEVAINTVLTPANMSVVEGMVQFAKDHDVWKVSFIPVVPRGLALMMSEYHLTPSAVGEIRDEIGRLAGSAPPVVRCIDIRQKDYWIIENDGSMWVERATHAQDSQLCDNLGLKDWLEEAIAYTEGVLR
ncbi:MAG TPA: radical SAM protein [Acidimicrobiales bacterium]|nr:radical SAM protein [Acidimicrobiales bacterium]